MERQGAGLGDGGSGDLSEEELPKEGPSGDSGEMRREAFSSLPEVYVSLLLSSSLWSGEAEGHVGLGRGERERPVGSVSM